jgi:hypothetical protein
LYRFSQMQAHLDWQGSAQLFRPQIPLPESISLRITPSGLALFGNPLQLELPAGSFHISEQPNTAFVKITADALGGSVVMLSDPSGIAALERYGFFAPSRSFKTPSYTGILIFFAVLTVAGILFFTLGLQAWFHGVQHASRLNSNAPLANLPWHKLSTPSASARTRQHKPPCKNVLTLSQAGDRIPRCIFKSRL